MKSKIVLLLLIVLVSCSKDEVPTINAPIFSQIKPIEHPKMPKGFYVGKTSYELKTPYGFVVNIDSLRGTFGILNKGKGNGTNNTAYAYVDINNDGYEDIFYPYVSDGEYNMKADVFVNKGTKYELDNSMLPDNYNGNQHTRKTVISDFNNDSLPDILLINHGFENPNTKYFPGEENTLLISNKVKGKYELGNITQIGKNFWHGGAAGDLNGDGNSDIVLANGGPQIYLGNGKGNFSLYNHKGNMNRPGYITTEIVDVDKNGKNDIIIAGDEGRPAPAIYSKSAIYWNEDDFSKETIICEPSTSGWGTITDIVCYDIDSDNINEIILARTGDSQGNWYGGYQLNTYKTNNQYKTFENKSDFFIKDYLVRQDQIGGWPKRLIIKNQNNNLQLICDISGSYLSKWLPTTKIFTQNKSTKLFE